MPAIIKVVDGRTVIKVGENTVAAGAAAALAEQFANAAGMSANAADMSANAADMSANAVEIAAAAVGVYTTVGDGEAATTNGQSFYVASGGKITLYRNDNGVADPLADLTTGGTMTGTLVTVQSATGQEALIIPPGVAPTSPTDGSIWSTAAGFFARIAGATRQLATLDGAETLVSKTIGDTGTVNASTAGFRGIPLISKTSAYTLALVDAGKQVSITTGGVVIPANGGVGFPIGTTIAVYNDSSSAQNISITTDTLRQAGTANTGTRALAGYGLATLVKVAATTWVISGAGLS